MKKVAVIQTPSKFFDVARIFCEVEKDIANYFDKIYVISDHKNMQEALPDHATAIELDKDYNFSGNMIRALPQIEEDIFFVCCEDHVFKDDNDTSKWDACFDFMQDEEFKAGFLRFTYHKGVPCKPIFPKGRYSFIHRLPKKYKYYIGLQPSLWRKDFFANALKDGEDAWKFEIKGSKRCKNNIKYRSYCVNKTIISFTNFLKSGNMYRRQYIDYIVKNNEELPKERKVYANKKPTDFNQYLEESRKRLKNE